VLEVHTLFKDTQI